MHIKVRNYYLIASIVLFCLYLFFYFFTFKPSLPSVKNLPISEEKIYIVKPVLTSRIWENAELYLPTVQTSPNDKKYWLVQLREKFDLKMRNFDELFFAEKRIAELSKWGNTLSQAQWEENLNVYDKLMQKYLYSKLLNLSEDQRSDQTISLYQKINSHESKLRESVDNALFPLNVQKKLNNKIFGIINPLKLTLVNNQENDDLEYSFAPIINDKEFGTYSINDDQVIEITPDNPIKTYAVEYPFTPFEFKFTGFLEPDEINIFYKYRYQTNQVLKADRKYLARVKTFGGQPFKILLNQRTSATESAQLFKEMVYPYKNSVTKTILFTTPPFNLEYFPTITIQSKYKIPTYNITVLPVFEKDITLTKIGPPINYYPEINLVKTGQNQYRIYYYNTTLDQDNFIKASFGFFWKIQEDSANSFTVSIRFLPFFKYLTIFSFFIFIFFNFIRSSISSLINIVLKISQFLRFPILIISLVLIFNDILFIPKSNDVFILFVLLFWTLFIIGFRAEARISFLFALVYLVISPVFILLQKEAVAEKSAIWAYMMLVAGTVQSIIEMKFNLETLRSPRQVFEIISQNPFIMLIIIIILFVKSIIVKIKKTLFRIIAKIISNIYRCLDLIINLKPANFFELMFSLLKGLVLIVFLMYSGKIIFKKANIMYAEYQKKVIMENRKKLYTSRQPKINLIEPTLVYKATKVIIYGENFGWDTKNVKALIDGKEIDAVLWTDSKIIFPVPLEWKDGYHKIWIEKQIDWDGKKTTAKSEAFEIKVLPITGNYTEDDGLYFEQMKTWRPETREVNGYK